MDMPFYPDNTPPLEIARGLTRHALKATNERRRQTLIDLAGLHMDLALLDAAIAPACRSPRTGH
ncbi:hypothetical protein QT196_38865 (plasmid) [Streptomyces sp. P9-2B-2]|uniref:hypothetical protein n=1 Tax=Streptomyces sp. P9-2B-2 TaxID=3057114 RepID=UPI0025B31E5F|nr:hypothetical protein [Streptomyces sp. P9-2B-2]WJY43226.1 hypothetical protein QT196_38865 [Streptomyces sp. P9-2B-2]